MRILLFPLLFILIGCDYRIDVPTAPSNTITNNNTNTNTNNIDIHDLVNFVPTFPPTTTDPTNPSVGTPLPIPTGSESTARLSATSNSHLLASSCQNTQFRDAVVNALKNTDSRWGYVSKGGCTTTSKDSIAYRATNSDTGIWIVDIIGNHCGTGTIFTWNIVGYSAEMAWCSR